MKIDNQAHGPVVVLVPRGPLVREEVDSFTGTVSTQISQRGGRVVIDLHDVPYLDSGGIESLLAVFSGAKSPTARPKLAALTETCREALDLTDALARMEVFDTVENAIRSFNR